jgi:F-type H+-transporting ATPase subunit delta
MALGGSAARRYAEAMLDIAAEAKAVDAYRASLARFASALGTEMLGLLRDPGVPLARRLAAMRDAAASEPAPVRALLEMLIERGRIALLPRIAATFGELVDERAGIAKARVTTAVAIGRPEQERVVAELGRATGKTIRATFAVDRALLGGATVQVGDHLVDASVRARLDDLRRQLAS